MFTYLLPSAMTPLRFLLAATLASLDACQSTPATNSTAKHPAAAAATSSGQTYGAAVTAAGARPLAELKQALGNQDSARVKLVGKAEAVCQVKGCWLTLTTPEGQPVRVRFKDYAFFVPKDIAGKTVVIDGWARRQQVPVAELQHYAQDAGKSAPEIAAITQPEEQLNFEAAGVLVVNTP